MIPRRRLLQYTAVAAAGTFGLRPNRAVLAQGGAMRTQAINPGLILVSGNGNNVLVRKAANGELLAVDGGLAANAAQLLETIDSALGSRRITTLLNTHWHHESTGLNAELGPRNVRIFAHENTRQWLNTRIERLWEPGVVFEPLPVQAQPNDVFYHYGSLAHADVQIDYGLMRQAHTDGDMYVFFPQDNVLHTGGIVSSDAWPLMDWWTGGWIGGLVDGLETLLSIANESTIIVPATGPVMTRPELQAMRDMYAELFNTVRRQFQSAFSVEEQLASNPAAAWEGQYGDADQFIELSHWSLIPHYTPDA